MVYVKFKQNQTPAGYEVELSDRTLPNLTPRSELIGSVTGRSSPWDGLFLSMFVKPEYVSSVHTT